MHKLNTEGRWEMVLRDAGLWDKCIMETVEEVERGGIPYTLMCMSLPLLSHSVLYSQIMYSCLCMPPSWGTRCFFHPSVNQSRHGSQRAKGNGIHPSQQGQAPEAPAVDNTFVTDHWAIFQSDTSPLPASSKARVIREVGSLVWWRLWNPTPSHITCWKASKLQDPVGFICKALSPRLMVPNSGPDASTQKEGWKTHKHLFI